MRNAFLLMGALLLASCDGPMTDAAQQQAPATLRDISRYAQWEVSGRADINGRYVIKLRGKDQFGGVDSQSIRVPKEVYDVILTEKIIGLQWEAIDAAYAPKPPPAAPPKDGELPRITLQHLQVTQGVVCAKLQKLCHIERVLVIKIDEHDLHFQADPDAYAAVQVGTMLPLKK
jgi:hypothetical protein